MLDGAVIALFLLLLPVVALLTWLFVPAILSSEHARRRSRVQNPRESVLRESDSSDSGRPVPSHLPAPPLPPDQV
jgi:hypothetical protein